MKKLFLLLITIISIQAYSQIEIENFCYTNGEISVRYSNPDTVVNFTEKELGPEYATLELIICEAYGIESSQVISFIYQNKSQTAWLLKERIGLIIVGSEKYNWKLIDEENFSPSQLYAINDFGEKLKTLINTK